MPRRKVFLRLPVQPSRFADRRGAAELPLCGHTPNFEWLLGFSESQLPFLVQHGFEQSDDPCDVLVRHFVEELCRPCP